MRYKAVFIATVTGVTIVDDSEISYYNKKDAGKRI